MDFKQITISLVKPLIFPKCYIDESPIGYLLRLANINNYRSCNWLIENNSITSKTPTYNVACHLLNNSSWTGFNKKYIAYKLCNYSLKDLQPTILRYCPLCFRENNYYRMIWHLKISVVCLKHKIWLNDFCLHCGQLIKYNYSPFGQCLCGEPFSLSVDSYPIPKGVYDIQYYLLNGTFTKRKQTFIENLELSLHQRTEFFIFLIRWLPETIHKRRQTRKYFRFDRLHDFRDSIIQVSEIILSGAIGFRSYLESISELDKEYNPDNKHRRSLFVAFYHSFYKFFPEDNFFIFREIIEDYIKHTWKKQLTQRNTLFNPLTRQRHPWIPIKKAAAEFNIVPSLLKRVIKDKLLIAVEEKKDTRTFTLVYRPSIRLQVSKIKNMFSFKRAANRLGTTKSQLNQLIADNHFSDAIAPKENYSQQWQFSSETIQNYLSALFERVVELEGSTITIAEAMRVIGNRIEQPLPKLIKAILNKELAVTTIKRKPDNRNLRSLAIANTAFNEWIKRTIEPNNYLSIPQLAKLLTINQESAYQLVNMGIINYYVDNNSSQKLITTTDLETFKARYVFWQGYQRLLK